MPKKRVLVLSASVGAGHLRAGEALAVAGQDSSLEVVHQDVLELMPRPFQTLYRDAYLDMVGRAPHIFGWLYELTDKPFQEDILRQAFEEVSAGKFYQFVDKFDPDLALCTHFLPSSLLHKRRQKQKFSRTLATVVTDFDVHGMWLATPSDHYFVAVPEARAYLRTFGVSGRAISVTGIPTHPVFSQPAERPQVAARLGLRADLPTILISTGGFGVSNVSQLLEALQDVKVPTQIVAACGRNEDLRQKLQTQFGSQPDLHIIGFTKEFDQYMSCADLMLGKPGGLTTWESFVKGLAWVVVNPIPGQEERNTYHLLEEGVGVWAYEARTLAFKVDQLLQEDGRLQRMRQNSLRLARPQAAHEILSICQDLLGL
ncbi:UDP-N-acetylglucosamine--LPS N-acetylglucosamine transferase [bacterium]|nr:UDP-N-acetylglucosamine--LPS N-acetylglucosamine transferase [bacterium]